MILTKQRQNKKESDTKRNTDEPVVKEMNAQKTLKRNNLQERLMNVRKIIDEYSDNHSQPIRQNASSASSG